MAVQQFKIGRKIKANRALNPKRSEFFSAKSNYGTASKIMEPTRKVEHLQRYKFNENSPVGKLLNSLSFKLADIDIELLLKGEESIKEVKKQVEVVIT